MISKFLLLGSHAASGFNLSTLSTILLRPSHISKSLIRKQISATFLSAHYSLPFYRLHSCYSDMLRTLNPQDFVVKVMKYVREAIQ
jgi:hypothetical protein